MLGRLMTAACWSGALLVALGLTGPACAVETELVPATAASKPFLRATIDLGEHGFTEEEYLVSGSGTVYEYDGANNLQVQTPDVDYRTRILVRKPAAHRFNGVVVVEMLNPTAGFDLDFEWHFLRELLLGDGYAWVGLTMKDVSIEDLAEWDPGRYGTLSMDDNGLAYDMFGAVAALVRDGNDAENPLAGYAVETVIGTGYSQSADYLTTFSNEFHETTVAWDGRPAFDGYLLGGGNGAARRINSADSEFYDDERRFNTVNAPLVRVQSETEVEIFFRPSTRIRMPDSDVFRLYEVAGGSHGDKEILFRTGEAISRDVGGPILPPCAYPLSPLTMGPAHRSALDHLVRWTTDGTPPPAGRWIEVNGLGEVLRDGFGNALGGVRLPPIAVPLGRFQPYNSGPGPCLPSGSFFEFDEATLATLYPEHGDYVSAVAHSANDNTRGGYLLRDDAKLYVVEAAHSEVGQ